MAGRGPQTFRKRQKEEQRKEKQQEKMLRRRRISSQSPDAPQSTAENPVEAGETLEQDPGPNQHLA